jgi:hypothetical protein
MSAGDALGTDRASRYLLGHQQRRVEPLLQGGLGGNADVAGQQAHDSRKRHHHGCAQEDGVDQHRVRSLWPGAEPVADLDERFDLH